MKRMPWFLLILLLLANCQSSENKSTIDTTKMVYDTSNAGPLVNHPSKNFLASWKTHLKDTSYLTGNAMLFLIPNKARLAELQGSIDSSEWQQADEAFAEGIFHTVDSVRKESKYKHVRATASYMRYILIKDCLNGPLVIDRDSVNFGYILSGPGKQIKPEYNSAHSGDYLGEIDEYFSLK